LTRVLFLDIDGVLNSDGYRHGTGFGVSANELIDPAAVETLNEITRRWSLKVVVSSSWRVMPEVEGILRANGVQADIIGKTPAQPGPRCREIERWLAEHPEVTSYVILDDDADMGAMLDHLVQTDYRHGLRSEHIARVGAALNVRVGEPR